MRMHTGCLYLIDLVVHFHTGFLASWRGKYVSVINGYQVIEWLLASSFGL